MVRCSHLQLVAPTGHSLPLVPFPPSAVVPISLSPPCVLPLCLAYLFLSTSLSFPSGGCANGAPELSLFHCSVSGPHGGGRRPSPVIRCVQVVIPNRRWGPPPQRLLGPGMSTCGVCSPTGAHHNPPPAHSRAQSSLWRAVGGLSTGLGLRGRGPKHSERWQRKRGGGGRKSTATVYLSIDAT